MFRHLESVYRQKNFTSYAFYNYYFLDRLQGSSKSGENVIEDVPDFFHMMRHIYRSAYHTPFPLMKSVVRTSDVKTLFSHFPTSCLRGQCQYRRVDSEIGYLAHYRTTCQVSIEVQHLNGLSVCLFFRDTLYITGASRISEQFRNGPWGLIGGLFGPWA